MENRSAWLGYVARTSPSSETFQLPSPSGWITADAEISGAILDKAEILRIKGEAILMRDRSAKDNAESCFRAGIAIARTPEAKWWELRATVSLARLLAKQGRRGEAREMLAEIYNWFTEGFDTADLKDAKVLLDELSR